MSSAARGVVVWMSGCCSVRNCSAGRSVLSRPALGGARWVLRLRGQPLDSEGEAPEGEVSDGPGGPAGGSCHKGRRRCRHKMLWLECPPRLPGHKMSENYTRVIPPLSTTCFRLFGRTGLPAGPGADRVGAAGGADGGCPPGRAVLRRERQVERASKGSRSRSRPASRERQNVSHRSVVHAAAVYPGSNLRTAPCGAIGEQPCELPVDCRWTTGVVLHSRPQVARERGLRRTL